VPCGILGRERDCAAGFPRSRKRNDGVFAVLPPAYNKRLQESTSGSGHGCVHEESCMLKKGAVNGRHGVEMAVTGAFWSWGSVRGIPK